MKRSTWYKIIRGIAVLFVLELMHYVPRYFDGESKKNFFSDEKVSEEFLATHSEQEVAKFLDESVNQFSEDADKLRLYMFAGYAYLNNGNFQLAILEFEKAKKYVVQDTADFYSLLGEIDLADGKTKKALYEFNLGYAKDANNPYINYALGRFYLGRSEESKPYFDYDKALQHLKIVFESEKDLNEFLDTYGN